MHNVKTHNSLKDKTNCFGRKHTMLVLIVKNVVKKKSYFYQLLRKEVTENLIFFFKNYAP